MTTIVTILTEGFADWEAALLNAVARGYYSVETKFVSPDGAPVRSSGGMLVTPDAALGDIDLAAIDAVVVNGGSIWQSPDAPDLGAFLSSAREQGKIVAGICDGTVALARAGLLDHVAHTSNGAGYLDFTGYAGGSLYRDVPFATVDQNIVTAPATAPVSFLGAVMGALGLADAMLDQYLGMHAAEHTQHRAAA